MCCFWLAQIETNIWERAWGQALLVFSARFLFAFTFFAAGMVSILCYLYVALFGHLLWIVGKERMKYSYQGIESMLLFFFVRPTLRTYCREVVAKGNRSRCKTNAIVINPRPSGNKKVP